MFRLFHVKYRDGGRTYWRVSYSFARFLARRYDGRVVFFWSK